MNLLSLYQEPPARSRREGCDGEDAGAPQEDAGFGAGFVARRWCFGLAAFLGVRAGGLLFQVELLLGCVNFLAVETALLLNEGLRLRLGAAQSESQHGPRHEPALVQRRLVE